MYDLTCNLPQIVQKKVCVCVHNTHITYIKHVTVHVLDGIYTTYFCQPMCIYIIATGKNIKNVSVLTFAYNFKINN